MFPRDKIASAETTEIGDNRSMEGRKVERWVNGWIMGQTDRRRDQSVN